MNRFQAFGLGKRRWQDTGNVGRYMLATDRHRIGIDQLAIHEDGDGRGAAADIDHRAAKIAVLVRQAGKPCRIAGMDETFRAQMVQRQRLDHVGQAGAKRRHIQVIDSKVAPAHACRVSDAAHIIQTVMKRVKLHQLQRWIDGLRPAAVKKTTHIAAADGAVRQLHVLPADLRARAATRQNDRDRGNRQIRCTLGTLHCMADGIAKRRQRGDLAAAHASRGVRSLAKKAQLTLPVNLADHAADLGAADVQNGKRPSDAAPTPQIHLCLLFMCSSPGRGPGCWARQPSGREPACR